MLNNIVAQNNNSLVYKRKLKVQSSYLKKPHNQINNNDQKNWTRNNNKIKEKQSKIESKTIICPTCHEDALINIKDYKITLFNCKNRHINENILLNEFNQT